MFSALPSLGLSHRIVMAPLTRVRGNERFAPTDDVEVYYRQRASAGGLLITEGCPISPETPYEYACGIYTEEQERGWKRVVDAVHAKSCKISLQLWHLGRLSHASWAQHPFLKSLGRPLPSVSSSALAPSQVSRTPSGEKEPLTAPRPLSVEELGGRVLEDYRKAAQAAARCGFDFVEVHAAHGYLMDQFFCDGVNKRTDEYGTQSLENRTRLLSAVLKEVIAVMGKEHVAVRISPVYPDTFCYQGCNDSDPQRLYRDVVAWLDQFRLAYLLLSEPRWNGGRNNTDPRSDPSYLLPMRHGWAKEVYHGPIIGASSFTPASAEAAIKAGVYDAIAFGRFFISNPDLVDRIREGKSLNLYDITTFYSKGPHGYIDYPTFKEVKDFPQFNSDEIGSKIPSKL